MTPPQQEYERNDRILDGSFTTLDVISYIKDCPINPTGKNSGFYQVPKSRIESFESVIRFRQSSQPEYAINYGAVMTIRQMMINARIDEGLINRIEETICSRPSPAPVDDTELEDLGNQDIDPAVFETYANACDRGAQEQFLREHDAAIRNETLDKVLSVLSLGPSEQKAINSLRSTNPQEQHTTGGAQR